MKRFALSLVFAALASACGARTGLEERLDGGVSIDASDARLDARRVDAGACVATTEVCDDEDNDCDGNTDEGVRSACDDCRVGCHRERIPGATWSLDDAEGVSVDEMGRLRLSSTRTESHDAWIANYRFGTVTRLDTRTGVQLAEYDSVILNGTNHAAPAGVECEVERPGGNCPSRTAVDLSGNVYIANRAFFGQATITKIAGSTSECIDRNGNGHIDTSRDLDGNGVIDRARAGEFLGQNDECILYTVDVGGPGDIARAIAIDARGHVWVGLFRASRALELDPLDGHVLRTVSLRELMPYGAVADGSGRVWFVQIGSGRILAFEARSGRLLDDVTVRAPDGCTGSYGIASGPDGTIWVAGFTCPWVFGYNPTSHESRSIALPDSGVTRGIAVDAEGRVYLASSHEFITFDRFGRIADASPPLSRITFVDPTRTPPRVEVLGTPTAPLPGLASTGVGISDGAAWLINQDSSTATQIDLATRAVREHPTGIAPYTYSDFTGYALRTFTAPDGVVHERFMGCAAGPTEWESMTWNADLPAGTSVTMRLRTARNEAALRSAPWVGPFTVRPTDLTAMPGPLGTDPWLEVELHLESGGTGASPEISNLVVQYNCPL